MAGPIIVRGTNEKPAASDALAEFFSRADELEGHLFIGYPIIATAEGKQPIDAVFLSPAHGLVVFDLVEGRDLGDYEQRQDSAATFLQSRLFTHRDLVRKRQLLVPLAAITFAPALGTSALPDNAEYPVANAGNLGDVLAHAVWSAGTAEVFGRTLSALQSISTIRRSRTGRGNLREGSRAERLARLEESIATLDNLQSKAVIETVDGVQRIRGLAGSGKTIVLALKAAYLHAQHPDWRIAVTFNTRSLKGHFTRLINNFSVDQSGEEPDWDRVRVINGWGGPGGPVRDGIYHEFCTQHGVDFLDFNAARTKFGRSNAFGGACAQALASANDVRPLYDVILVDEAQDFPVEFLRLCHAILDSNKRLVYAYDELQNLSGASMPSAEDIFGKDLDGNAVVSFAEPSGVVGARNDIILEKCYRNSRPVLVTAHALGFGTYRPKPATATTGLVQMFDEPGLWTDIGYRVIDGDLLPGSEVTLARTAETSPTFLESHSDIDDLVSFHLFASEREQAEWVADQISQNLREDELRHDDIVVINTDPITTREKLGPIRKSLLERNIMCHVAGVETSADVFFRPEAESVTFTGIFRAKGNEAAMVYIVNGQECQSDRGNLALVRNRLFTAITRSKAWVRVTGVGPAMQSLIEEFERIKAADFRLRFRYPTPPELEQLQIVHRDMTQAERENVRNRRESLTGLLEDLEAGRLFPEDLDPDVLARLRSVLGSDEDER